MYVKAKKIVKVLAYWAPVNDGLAIEFIWLQ